MIYCLKNYFSRWYYKFIGSKKEVKKTIALYNKREIILKKLFVEPKPHANNWLVIKVDDIGDFLLFIPAFNTFVSANKHIKFTLLFNATCNDLINELITHNNVIKLPFNKSEWFSNNVYITQMAKQLVAKNFEKVFFPSYSRMPLLEGLLQVLFLPQNVYAFKRIAEPFESSMLINKLNSVANLFDTNNNYLHELALNDMFFNKVNNTNNAPISIAVAEKYTAPNIPGNYIVICAGGNQKSKQYNKNNYRLLLKLLAQKLRGYCFVIVGSAKDYKNAQQITNQIPNTINLCGKTTLPHLLSVCKHARLYIGNDTAAAHMAALQQTKTLVIANGNRYGRFFPYPTSFNNVLALYPKQFKQAKQNYNWPNKTAINAVNYKTIYNAAIKWLGV